MRGWRDLHSCLSGSVVCSLDSEVTAGLDRTVVTGKLKMPDYAQEISQMRK